MQTIQDSGPRGTILCSVRTATDGRRFAKLEGIGYLYEPRLSPDLKIEDMQNREVAGWRCSVQRPFRKKGVTAPANAVEPENLVEVLYFAPEAAAKK